MAVLLNAVSVATTSAGVEITGDFEVSCSGPLGGGVAELQRSIDDVAANYSPVGVEGIFFGKGHAAISNVGTNWYRGVFRPNPIREVGPAPAVTLTTDQ